MKEPIVDSNKLCEDEEDKEMMKSTRKWFEVFLFISIVLGFFLLGFVGYLNG